MRTARQVVKSHSIRNFATRYLLNPTLDKQDLTEIISGRTGQIYDHGEGLLAVMFLPPKGRWMPRKWGNVRRACIEAGMTLLLDCDSEGSLSFDSENQDEAKLAIRVAGIKSRRRLSDEQRARLRAIGSASKLARGTAQERPLSA